MKFFAGLQAALDEREKELLGETWEVVPGESIDKARLAIYYLTDWVLQRGERPFTAADLATACRGLSPKIAPAAELVDEVVDGLIATLLAIKYLEEIVPQRDQEVVVASPSTLPPPRVSRS